MDESVDSPPDSGECEPVNYRYQRKRSRDEEVQPPLPPPPPPPPLALLPQQQQECPRYDSPSEAETETEAPPPIERIQSSEETLQDPAQQHPTVEQQQQLAAILSVLSQTTPLHGAKQAYTSSGPSRKLSRNVAKVSNVLPRL